MARGDLTDHEWRRLEPLLPAQRTGRRGNQYHDHRTTLNGILWVLRTGAPWRDLPERYGPWQTCPSATAPGRPATPASGAGAPRASSSGH